MSYIWENYSSENKFSMMNFGGSISEEAHINNIFVDVNVRKRFSKFFGNDIAEYLSLTENRDIFNIFIHALAQRDIIRGDLYSRAEYYVIQSEIEQGLYGKSVREKFSLLEPHDRRIILFYMKYSHKNAERKDIFNEVFFEFFGKMQNEAGTRKRWNPNFSEHAAEIYYRNSRDIYYCFCAAEKNDYNQNAFELIKELFCDYNKKIKVIWGRYCFGMLDSVREKSPVEAKLDSIILL